ncbi:MAG: GNAT family N-acetyltransferase, partial [Bacilli bacterium]|nr:GNAT family N-acetyltransferase [Bacilli bacterium]
MIYLKKINLDDIDKEYDALIRIPQNENGFENKYYNVTKENFKNVIIPKLIRNSEGKDLQEGRVPDTYFFLWDDDVIVGLFKIRHYLNDYLRQGVGHISYGILKEYRGLGYATKGLEVAIEISKSLIKEDEIYLSSNKNNPASLKIQIKCGAYLVGEDNEQYFTRIKLNNT